jgi:hypothetical protein
MAWPLRVEYAGAFYHVTARGNERKKIYFGDGDYTLPLLTHKKREEANLTSICPL